MTGGGYSDDYLRQIFSTGLKGMAVERSQDRSADHQTLAETCGDGIDPEMIVASINTLEFHLREKTTPAASRADRHDDAGADPCGCTAAIPWPSCFEKPRCQSSRLAQHPAIFEGLIQRLLAEEHPRPVIMRPDPTMRLQKTVGGPGTDRLDDSPHRMTPDDVEAVIEATRHLRLAGNPRSAPKHWPPSPC